MKKLGIPLAVFCTVCQVLGATPLPAVKIVSPTKSSTTNGLLNASGHATGVAPLTVYYSLNGGGWFPANGTTNWSASNLPLTPGPNVFSVYAQDANLAISKTNTVDFFYVVKVPMTVSTNGNGGTSPKLNGESLEIGKKYSISARPAKGFAFTGWMLNGEPLTNTARISFIMASNLSLTANFQDVKRPACIITFPAVKHSVAVSPINITGRASDNAEVTGVFYNLDSMGWFPATLGSNGNWEANYQFVTMGGNDVQAYAVDAAGNASLTNTVNFNCVSTTPPPGGHAPASIAGLIGQVNPGNQQGGIFPICFGATSYAVFSPGISTYEGNYAYTVSNNTVQLVSQVVENGDPFANTLVFLNDTTAIFSSLNDYQGVITFSPATNFAPSTSAYLAIQFVDDAGVTNVTALGGGTFTDSDSQGGTNWGTYTLEAFSPQDMLLTEYYLNNSLANDKNTVHLHFTNYAAGAFLFYQTNPNNDPINYGPGNFSILSNTNPPAGNAPDSVEGLVWNLSPTNASAVQLCFGTDTYSRSSADTNENELGDYSYIKTSANTAQLNAMEAAPFRGYNNDFAPENPVYLTFTSTNTASFFTTNTAGGVTNVEGGTVSISAAPTNLVPASVLGSVFTATFSDHTETVTLDSTGDYTHSSNNVATDSGIYSFSQFSPIGALLYLPNGDSSHVSYLQLTFTSATGGNVFATEFDQNGETEAQAGTFTVQQMP